MECFGECVVHPPTKLGSEGHQPKAIGTSVSIANELTVAKTLYGAVDILGLPRYTSDLKEQSL
jgi:hypothetical protein